MSINLVKCSFSHTENDVLVEAKNWETTRATLIQCLSFNQNRINHIVFTDVKCSYWTYNNVIVVILVIAKQNPHWLFIVEQQNLNDFQL